MTKQDATKYFGIPGAVIALATVLALVLAMSGFARAADVEKIEARVNTLESRLTDIERGVTLSNCLQLADRQNTPWQRCMAGGQ